MPETQKPELSSRTLCIELSELEFETLEQSQGHATVIRFRLLNQSVTPGDVLLVLEGPEIRFHGRIGTVDEGWAVAADPRGSRIPAAVH